MTCKNCGHRISENYCSHCGQRTDVDRINWTNFLEDISEGLFQVNKGFFYTLKELFTRPGHSIKEFLDGKRKRHFKPIAYLVTLSTVYFLTAQVVDQPTWIDDGAAGFIDFGMTEEEIEESIALRTLNWFSKNYTYVTLLLVPVYSLGSYLFFRKFNANYLEHIVINAYITGQQAIFYALFTIIAIFPENNFLEAIPLLIAVAYNFWVFRQLFAQGHWIIHILRFTMTYVLYFVFSLAMVLVMIGISEL
jgi:hypothetical protein